MDFGTYLHHENQNLSISYHSSTQVHCNPHKYDVCHIYIVTDPSRHANTISLSFISDTMSKDYHMYTFPKYLHRIDVVRN